MQIDVRLEFSGKYKELFKTKARYIHLWGGRGRGGSFTGTQYFLHLIIQPVYFRGYFMREVAGDVRESLWRDFKDRIDEAGLDDMFDLNESIMSATYRPTGNIILSKGFKKSSGNRTAKLKSLAGATHVMIEESEEIAEQDFKQLDDSLRTTKTGNLQIISIFNPPPKKHWIWKRHYNLIESGVDGFFKAIPKKDPLFLSIYSNFKDNLSNLNESSITNFEQYLKDDPDYYYSMILGLIPEGARGRIYRNWQPIKEMPNEHSKFYGLDWGFSGDPLALVEIESHNRDLFIDEKIYEHGMTNDDLDKALRNLKIPKSAPIVADSAQPKDIEDMRRKGWNFVPAKKGSGSIKSGIKFIQQYNVYLTERSVNTWNEVESYAWALDQHKHPTDDPIDKFNHAMDAINYGMDRIRHKTGMRVI